MSAVIAPAIERLPRDESRGVRLRPDANGSLMSPEEFDAARDWDEDDSYELIRAVVIVNEELGRWLRNYREQHPDGVAEYCVIDRFRRQMTVYFVDGTERVVAESETYESPLLPGFMRVLARLLAVADDWRASDEE